MMERSVARLLVRAPNWLGDVAFAMPAMVALRDAYKASHLTVAAPASVLPVFREHTLVAPDDLLEVSSNRGERVTALSRGQFDAVVLFPNSFRTAWEAKQAGIPERWGYGFFGRRWLLTRAVTRPPGRTVGVEYYNSLVRGLGVSFEPVPVPVLTPSESSVGGAEALLRRHRWPETATFVALMPGAAYGQAKQWLPDRMAEVAARLVRERNARCVILGAAHDRTAARAIESWLREKAPEEQSRVLDLVGQTSLGALIGLLSRADVCIANDSGGLHLAAALGRPVVAIFGPTDEGPARPLGDPVVITESVFCRPCMLRDCPIDHRCMKRITADRVFNAAAALLARAGAA
jgi:heptosyltransferase-2